MMSLLEIRMRSGVTGQRRAIILISGVTTKQFVKIESYARSTRFTITSTIPQQSHHCYIGGMVGNQPWAKISVGGSMAKVYVSGQRRLEVTLQFLLSQQLVFCRECMTKTKPLLKQSQTEVGIVL